MIRNKAKWKRNISRALKGKKKKRFPVKTALVGGLIGAGVVLSNRRKSPSLSNPLLKQSLMGLPGKFPGATPSDLRWNQSFIQDFPEIKPGRLGQFRKKGKDPYSKSVKKPNYLL